VLNQTTFELQFLLARPKVQAFFNSYQLESPKIIMQTHPLIETLVHLEGNPRACVYTEPLWGIPYNLYIPYASVYMLALGVSDSQIGLLVTIGMFFQIFLALISGAITDKLGRRWTTFIFDFIAWSIPVLIWAVAQNFYYFLIAAILNSAWRITMNSWNCLLVEDAQQDQLVHIWTWVYISGLLVAFVSPIAGILIGKFSLIPTARFLYLVAFVLMSIKFVVLFIYSTETKQGKVRLAETHGKYFFSLIGGYGEVFRQILRTPRTLVSLGIMVVFSICYMISGTFWSIFVTQKLGLPQAHIAIYPFARSIVMMIFFFVVMPRIKTTEFQKPMMIGFVGFIIAEIILINMTELNYFLLLATVLIEACSLALVNPLMDSMVVINVDPQERARIMAILSVIVIICTSPFGWIAGQLSELNRALPFILNIVLFCAGAILVYAAGHLMVEQKT
jgi:MFS family permease